MIMVQQQISELLRLKKNGFLYHREGQELEFKEQFNLAGLGDYFRDFAAFANNRGGYLIFGVKDSPRTRVGLNKKSTEHFQTIDPEKITGFLLDIFSSEISWEQHEVTIGEKIFGAFKIHEASVKPIIAKKDEGKDQIIKNGDIYYRYGGRTQRVQYAELHSIITRRVEENNQQWLDLMGKIGKAGPQNAAILDTERSIIEKDKSQILVVDDELASKLQFIKEGSFSNKKGGETLKLVGNVLPVNKVEVVKRVKENLLRDYPLTAMDVQKAVRKRVPGATPKMVWDAISENGLKSNRDYAAYNFRNKAQEERFKDTGVVGSTPVIYNESAVDFIEKVVRNSLEEV